MSIENPFEEVPNEVPNIEGRPEDASLSEHNEIELGESGELIVSNQRREESTINRPDESVGSTNLEARFLEAKKFIDSLKPEQRAFVEQEVERNLRGIMPADYGEEYKKEFIEQAAKLDSLKK